MSTSKKIAASLPGMKTNEFHHIERVIHDLSRVNHHLCWMCKPVTQTLDNDDLLRYDSQMRDMTWQARLL